YRLIGYDRQKTERTSSDEKNVSSRSTPAGYTLTTFYEVVPTKRVSTATQSETSSVSEDASEPLLTAKLQLKPRGNEAAVERIQHAVSDTGLDFATAPGDLKFAAAVAEFGMILRDSEYKGKGSLQQVLEWAAQGKGADMSGYRADFIELVRKAQTLKKS